MKTHKLVATLLLSLAAIVPAIPALSQAIVPPEWHLLSQDKNGDRFYLSTDSILRRGNAVGFTVIQWKNYPDEYGIRAIMMEVAANCSSGYTEIGLTTILSSEGYVLDSYESEVAQTPPSGSPSDRARIEACGQ